MEFWCGNVGERASEEIFNRNERLKRGLPVEILRSLLECVHYRVDKVVQIVVTLPHFLDLLDGMQDGGVMLSTEVTADLRERGVGKLLHQKHRYLARIGDLAGVALHL